MRQAVIHYPSDKRVLEQIGREISDFRCAAIAEYIETQSLTERQTENLLDGLNNYFAIRQSDVSHRIV